MSSSRCDATSPSQRCICSDICPQRASLEPPDIKTHKACNFTDVCGKKPRRSPLLGVTDDPACKRERAFTVQAQQSVWDIDKPASVRTVKPVRSNSRFRIKYNGNRFPFHWDQSIESSMPRLAWHTEIDQCDVAVLLPDIATGLTDDALMAKIAQTALVDILRHVPAERFIAGLPSFILEFKEAARFNNETICRRLINALQSIALVQSTLGPQLAYYMRNLLVDLGQYYKGTLDMGERIIYEQSNYPHMSEMLDELLQILEEMSGSEREFATKGIKIAIPQYHVTDPNTGQ